MTPSPSLSVIIPAYNEAARIAQTVHELRHWLPSHLSDWEVRVVDDGSIDDTAAIVAAIAERDPHVVLQSEPHRGKGGAVRAGMLASTGDLRFICDADLSMPVHELRRFLDVPAGHADIVIGTREGKGARRVGEPVHRHVMGRAFNALVRRTLIANIHDTQCGFKLFTSHAAHTIFPRTTLDGWAFDLEVLHIAQRLGLRVAALPIEWHYRDRSQVSLVGDPWRMLRDVWRIRRNGRRGVYGVRPQDH